LKKYYLAGITTTFAIIFNLGYIFHDILMGDWLHSKQAAITREEYSIPAIAFTFILYSSIQAYLLPIFHYYTSSKYKWGIYKTAFIFGALIGFLWDALQGGIIEYATFKMPIEVVFVDSGFHIIEGAYTALILAFFYSKFNLKSKIYA